MAPQPCLDASVCISNGSFQSGWYNIVSGDVRASFRSTNSCSCLGSLLKKAPLCEGAKVLCASGHVFNIILKISYHAHKTFH